MTKDNITKWITSCSLAGIAISLMVFVTSPKPRYQFEMQYNDDGSDRVYVLDTQTGNFAKTRSHDLKNFGVYLRKDYWEGSLVVPMPRSSVSIPEIRETPPE